MPEKLAKQIELFNEDQNTYLVYTPIISFFENNSEITQKDPQLNGQKYLQLLRKCVIISASCVIVRRDIFDQGIRFCPECAPCDDFDLWLNISLKYNIRCTKQALVRYRKHQNNASVSGHLK